MKKNKSIFIAIEGPIGVGKTTLANILTEHFNAEPLGNMLK